MLKTVICGSLPTKKTSFFWNMMGSGMYAASSLLLTYITIRMVGENDGGAFAFALTIAQLLANFVYYETRNYQVTDVENRFSFGDYHSVKIINSFIMILIAVFFVRFRGYSHSKALLIILVCVYRMLDGYADGYESHFHANGRLDLAGKSMTFRALISLSIFFIALHFSGNVFSSILFTIAGAILGIIVFDIMVFDTVGKVMVSFNYRNICQILKDCFPLFLGMFLWTYILSASRIAVDSFMGDSFQAYFQVLFMPVSVVNLFATFILKPNLAELSEQYAMRSSGFIKTTLKLCAALIVFTIVCMFGAYLLGIPVLQIVSGLDITEYRMMFVFLIFAGGINSLGYLFYSLLLIFRWSNVIIGTYVAASIISLVASSKMTYKWGMWGASASYFVSVLFIMIVFGALVAYKCRAVNIISTGTIDESNYKVTDKGK